VCFVRGTGAVQRVLCSRCRVRNRRSAPVAQWIEQRFPKPQVAGSSPAGGASKIGHTLGVYLLGQLLCGSLCATESHEMPVVSRRGRDRNRWMGDHALGVNTASRDHGRPRHGVL
jgi:hypothetical protein